MIAAARGNIDVENSLKHCRYDGSDLAAPHAVTADTVGHYDRAMAQLAAGK